MELNPAQHTNSQPKLPEGSPYGGPDLGPNYVNPLRLKVWLKGHVTFPHFRDVNILIDIT
jgi:hypothetical protein